MRAHVTPIKNQIGLLLLEVMLSVFLGLLLISLLFTIYLTSQRSLGLQAALGQLQTNAQTALAILNRDIHLAGYIGCARWTADFPIHLRLAKLQGQGDHEITVRHASVHHVNLIAAMQNAVTVVAGRELSFKAGEELIISDCKQAEIFLARSVWNTRDSQKIISVLPLKHHYGPEAEIARWEVNHYFVEKSQHRHEDGSPVYALMKKNQQQPKTELVWDIEEIQFLYSLDQADELKDLPAAHVQDWSQITGVAIALKVASFPFKKPWYSYVAV